MHRCDRRIAPIISRQKYWDQKRFGGGCASWGGGGGQGGGGDIPWFSGAWIPDSGHTSEAERGTGQVEGRATQDMAPAGPIGAPKEGRGTDGSAIG